MYCVPTENDWIYLHGRHAIHKPQPSNGGPDWHARKIGMPGMPAQGLPFHRQDRRHSQEAHSVPIAQLFRLITSTHGVARMRMVAVMWAGSL